MNKRIRKVLANPSDFWVVPEAFPECPGYSGSNLVNFLKKEGLPHLGCGRHRSVFALNERHVVKVPRSFHSVNANYEEYYYSRKYPHLSAKSRVFGCSLIQERVWDPEFTWEYQVNSMRVSQERRDLFLSLKRIYNEASRWGDSHSMQAGKTVDGRLVAYDFNPY